ncbi:MAG: A24 family peptidase C-terminal domain-containing protein [Candidatus Bathyarchaeia archaeon]
MTAKALLEDMRMVHIQLTDPTLENLALTAVVVAFSLASFYDLKTREVPNMIWMTLLPIASALTSIRVIFFNLPMKPAIFSVVATFIIAFAAFYGGVFGGADAKALICLSAALPLRFKPFYSVLGYLHPLFPLTVLYNSYLLSTVVIARNVSLNTLYWSAGKSLFQGLEGEGICRRVLAFLTGYKASFKSLEDSPHLFPMEAVDNSGRRRFKFQSSAFAEKEDLLDGLRSHLIDRRVDVWVSPTIPLMVYMLAALVVTALLGDLFTWLVFEVLTRSRSIL